MVFNSPIISYIRELLDEHTLPLEGSEAGVIEAGWLVVLLHKLEEKYRDDGLL